MNKKKILCFCLALGAFSAMMAQETLSLSQCLQMAVENNLSLQKSRNEIAKGKYSISENQAKLLPQINEHFQALKRDNDNVARATIVSAFPLTNQQRDELKGALAKRFGRQIETVEEVDASLLGGARIIVGDQVIDRSVVGQLNKMSRQIKA